MGRSGLEKHAGYAWIGRGSRSMLGAHGDVTAKEACWVRVDRSQLEKHTNCTRRGHG